MASLPSHPKAILFGSIGTLVDTSQMQLDAFNQAFRDMGVDWHWTKEEYTPMLGMSGGKKRLAHYADQQGMSVDVDQLHQRKTYLYNQSMKAGNLQPRPGVVELIDRASKFDVPVAFCTSTYEQNIDTLFACIGAHLSKEHFAWIGNVHAVENPKPAPDIFQAALHAFGVAPQDAIAIEDTAICLQACVAAGVPSIGFPNQFADGNDMTGAVSIVSELDPDWLNAQPGALSGAA